MRARDLRDVVKVLIIPSLERALKELYGKGGSRRTARLLVQQSVDQLYGMMVVDKTPEPAATPARGITDDFELTNPAAGAEHDFSHDQTTEGFGICRCGVVDDSEASAKACTAGPADSYGNPAVGANHEFVEKPEGPMRCGRCGALDGSPSAALPCSKGPLD
jgi:hypothetical protein